MREPLLRLALPAAGIAVAAGIAGAAAFEMLRGYSNELLLGVSLVAFVVFFMWTLSEADRIVSSRARMIPAGQDTQRRVLIMGLSTMAEEHITDFEVLAEAGDFGEFAANVSDFEAACAARGEKPPYLKWQQNARAIRGHLKSFADKHAVQALELVLVLPSEESSVQVDRFRNGMRRFVPGLRIEVVTSGRRPEPFQVAGPDAMSYQNYNYVHHGLQRAIDQARRSGLHPPISHSHICIDITPGTKPFSVAAAVTTLNNEMLLGYIDNDGDPKYYDASVSFSKVGGFL